MTLPDERIWALKNTLKFLRDLLDPKKTPRVPKEVRREAYRCLKHYPGEYHIGLTEERNAFEVNAKPRADQ